MSTLSQANQLAWASAMLHLGGTVNASSCTETKLKLIKSINTDRFACSWSEKIFVSYLYCKCVFHELWCDSYDAAEIKQIVFCFKVETATLKSTRKELYITLMDLLIGKHKFHFCSHELCLIFHIFAVQFKLTIHFNSKIIHHKGRILGIIELSKFKECVKQPVFA